MVNHKRALKIKRFGMMPSRIWEVFRAVGFIGLVSLGPACGGTAQLAITPPSAPAPASPGDALTLPFTVKNISSERDIFDLSLEVSSGLELLGVPDPVELEPNAEETVFVSVFVSAKSRAGDKSVTLIFFDDNVAEQHQMADPRRQRHDRRGRAHNTRWGFS